MVAILEAQHTHLHKISYPINLEGLATRNTQVYKNISVVQKEISKKKWETTTNRNISGEHSCMK